MHDFRLGFSDSDAELLFKAFDINHDNTINYDEFLRIIRVSLPLSHLSRRAR